MLKHLFVSLTLSFFLCLQSFGQVCNRPNLDLFGFPADVNQAIMDYACGDIVQLHIDQAGPAHGPNFLQWHREYIEGLEAYLQSQGFGNFVPLPAWDPCSAVPMGSLTTCPQQNAMDASFEGSTMDCRGFADGLYDDCSDFCIYPDFAAFQTALQGDHNGIHNVLADSAGGVFSTAASPAVVIFWAWHAYVDEVYARYQGATLDPSLNIELERVDQGCCQFTFRVKKFCCGQGITWGVDAKKGGWDQVWEEDGYYYMSGTSTNLPGYTIYATLTSACGQTRTLGRSYLNDLQVPSIPSVPPFDLQYVCFDLDPDAYCYNFGNFECLIGLNVVSNHPKLIADVNGTELCLTYIFPQQATATITVTPIGACGDGDPVTWTIYANHREHCKDDPWHPRLTTDQIQVYPNPFSDQLTVNCTDLKLDKTHSISLIDMFGRVLEKTNDNSHSFDTSNLPNGVYLIQITAENDELLFMEKYLKS